MIGDVLVEDERVRLISFTGSAEVGWGLRERAARKKVLLELGNATPLIVEGDADVGEAAAKVAATSAAEPPEENVGEAGQEGDGKLQSNGSASRRRRGRRGGRRRSGARGGSGTSSSSE